MSITWAPLVLLRSGGPADAPCRVAALFVPQQGFQPRGRCPLPAAALGTIAAAAENPSEPACRRRLPQVPHLRPGRQFWTYCELWPNIALGIHPDQVYFMQVLPQMRTLIPVSALRPPPAARGSSHG